MQVLHVLFTPETRVGGDDDLFVFAFTIDTQRLIARFYGGQDRLQRVLFRTGTEGL